MEDRLRKLNVEVTTECNLNCIMCMRKALAEDTGHMSIETYEGLLPALPTIQSLNIIGIGEPLLNENTFEMIRLGKRNLPADGRVSLTTNGTLIDEHVARELVSSGVDDVVMSIDGAKAETYAAIRVGAQLAEVLQGMQLLNRAKAELNSSHPALGVEFVAMKRNIEELPDVLELAGQNGAGFFIVSNVLPHTPDIQGEILYDFNSDEAIELFEEARREAKERNLEFSFDSLDVENYANALFGVPPLKDKLRSGKPEWTQIRGYDSDIGRKFELLEETVAKARARNVCMSFKNLIPRNGNNLGHVTQVFAEAGRKASEVGISLDLPPVIPRARRECGFIKDRIAFVSWDGYVRPCNNLYHSYKCYVNGREKSITAVTFGNVRQEDLLDIWRSREYRSFRRQVDRFDFAPCGDCPHAEACFALMAPVFRKDCYEYTLPCGDCPWARGILQCM